jgi:hypothetical protein
VKKVIRAAVNLYQSFREKAPKRLKVVSFDVPEAVMVIGHVEEIAYRTTHGDKTEHYVHAFAPGSRPLLTASHDGRQLLLLGGRYMFTDRGIVDKDAKGRLIFEPEHGRDAGFLSRKQAD